MMSHSVRLHRMCSLACMHTYVSTYHFHVEASYVRLCVAPITENDVISLFAVILERTPHAHCSVRTCYCDALELEQLSGWCGVHTDDMSMGVVHRFMREDGVWTDEGRIEGIVQTDEERTLVHKLIMEG